MRWPLLLAPLAGLSGEAGVGRTGDAGVGSSAAKSEGMEASDDESEARPRPGEAPGLHNSHMAAEAGFSKVHASQDQAKPGDPRFSKVHCSHVAADAGFSKVHASQDQPTAWGRGINKPAQLYTLLLRHRPGRGGQESLETPPPK